METATEKIQLQLFDMKETYFPKLSDLQSNVPEVHPPEKYPKYCPVVSHALAMALLPGKGEVVAIGTKDSNDIAIIAPTRGIKNSFIYVVQIIGNKIQAATRGVRADGFSLNVLLDEKFKQSEAVVIRRKEKAWDFCRCFYKSKMDEFSDYKKTLEGKKV